MLTGLLLFRNHAVVSEREGSNPQLRVIDLHSNVEHRIHFPEPVYSAMLGLNPEHDAVCGRNAVDQDTDLGE
jgi:oligopeptidase B